MIVLSRAGSEEKEARRGGLRPGRRGRRDEDGGEMDWPDVGLGRTKPNGLRKPVG